VQSVPTARPTRTRAHRSPTAYECSALFAALVEDSLNEYAYDADLAGLVFRLTADPDGFKVCAGAQP
jgi:hypothetical protein